MKDIIIIIIIIIINSIVAWTEGDALYIIGVFLHSKQVLNFDIKAPTVKLSLTSVLITFQRYTTCITDGLVYRASSTDS